VLLAPSNRPAGPKNPSFIDISDDRRELLGLPKLHEQLLSPIPVKDCLEMGINTYYTTPLNLQELSNAIVPALESHAVAPGDSVKETILAILLAEDNLVNQKLAVKLLEVAGHKIEVADNGEIAFEKYRRRISARDPYDVILVSNQDASRELELINRWMFRCLSWVVWSLLDVFENTSRRKIFPEHLSLLLPLMR
jgi:osomolarity two-component system sensor histidine kinase NIK1